MHCVYPIYTSIYTYALRITHIYTYIHLYCTAYTPYIHLYALRVPHVYIYIHLYTAYNPYIHLYTPVCNADIYVHVKICTHTHQNTHQKMCTQIRNPEQFYVCISDWGRCHGRQSCVFLSSPRWCA